MKRLNYGDITLLPKVSSAERIQQFRPICLLRCPYKLITEVLDQRVVVYADKLISLTQNAFVKGRNIMDGVLSLHEILNYTHVKKRVGIVLKLDFEKAFDSIQHEAILKILVAKGFDSKWIKWVQQLLYYATSSILLNGVPGNHFKCKCGVKQGDPISPLLFVIAADLLQTMINDLLCRGLLTLPLPTHDPDYPIVQYADDTLLFVNAESTQLEVLKSVLNSFSLATGLQINFHKSSMYPINVEASVASALAALFGCQLGSMPFNYLGLPVGTTRPKIVDLLPLVDCMERRLTASSWFFP